MKMKKDKVSALRRLMDAVVKNAGMTYAEVGDYYRTNKIGRDYSARARWDIFWRIPADDLESLNLYDGGLNDTHVDSALKFITGIR